MKGMTTGRLRHPDLSALRFRSSAWLLEGRRVEQQARRVSPLMGRATASNMPDHDASPWRRE